MYRFEHDWFSNNVNNLEVIFQGYKGSKPLEILEIGAFEGRSTVWFLENIPNCTVMTIDTWKGGNDHSPDNPEINFTKVRENFDYNVQSFKDRVSIINSTSFQALSYLVSCGKKFDFIYVDGSHTAIDVNLDLILSFKLMTINSIIYCDDYLWGFNEFDVYNCPKLGIDSFVNVYANKLKPIIGFSNHAAIYCKVAE